MKEKKRTQIDGIHYILWMQRFSAMELKNPDTSKTISGVLLAASARTPVVFRYLLWKRNITFLKYNVGLPRRKYITDRSD